jgi:hypothetical protein
MLTIEEFFRLRPPIEVQDDYGFVGQGASNARSVRCENGSEYLLKGSQLSPANPWVAVNEQVSVLTARYLDLPVLKHDIALWNGELFFASEWMDKSTFRPHVTATTLAGCVNLSRIHGVVVLDAWICNKDRNPGNLIIRTAPAGRGGGDNLIPNDHSHALAHPDDVAAHGIAVLRQKITTPIDQYFALTEIRDAVTDEAALDEALAQAEGISDATIDGILDTVPAAWWRDPDGRPAYRDLLVGRKPLLRGLFAAGRAIFPNL